MEVRSGIEANGVGQVDGAEHGVPAVDRALDILEYLEHSEERPTLTDLASRLDLPKASAYRLLATLRARGYVEQSGTRGGYSLGARVLSLAARAEGQLDLARVSYEPMDELTRATGESCQLSIRVGERALCIARVVSPTHPEISLVGRVGSGFPLHAAAVGKTLLAFAPESERSEYLNQTLEAYTAFTHVLPEQLQGELEEIRQTGIAHDHQEYKLGLRAVAAPIFGHEGDVQAALAVPLLVTREEASDLWEMTEVLRATASMISRSLGYSPDQPLQPPNLAEKDR